MTVTSVSSLESGSEPRARHRRFGAATIAASLALALGPACSGGGGGSSPGAPATGGGASGGPTGTSGNANGQSGAAGASQGGAAGAAQAGGGPGGSSGATSSNGGVSTSAGGAGAGGAGQSGAAGSAGAKGSSGGSAGSDMGMPDAGTCCNTADCQPDAVKTCVCTQWGQTQCCGGTWDTLCQTTAEVKCQAEKCATEPSPSTPDGGHIAKGACCATHTTPGCDDSAIESCACALLGDCCTKQWDAVCVQLVREKRCEDGVRTCVCDQWQQSSCCDSQWTNYCGMVAESKCGAQPSCP